MNDKHSCTKCGSSNTEFIKDFLHRAYNSLCEQAAGASGWLCRNCSHIDWEEPDLDEWLKTKPDFIVPY